MNSQIKKKLEELKEQGKISYCDYNFSIDYFSKNIININIDEKTAMNFINEILTIFKRG